MATTIAARVVLVVADFRSLDNSVAAKDARAASGRAVEVGIGGHTTRSAATRISCVTVVANFPWFHRAVAAERASQPGNAAHPAGLDCATVHRTTVSACAVLVVALFMRFLHAIAALLTRLAGNRATKTDFHATRRAAAIARHAVGVVALLVSFEDSVAALEATLTGSRVDAVELRPFDRRAIAPASVATEDVAVIADFILVLDPIAAGLASDTTAIAVRVRGNGIALGYASDIVAQRAFVTDLVWTNGAVAAAIACHSRDIALESRLELANRSATVSALGVSIIASLGTFLDAVAAFFAQHSR